MKDLSYSLLLSLTVMLSISCGPSKDGDSSALLGQKNNGQNVRGKGGINGVSRWTPYQREQSGKGTCGPFRNFSGDSKQWAAVGEKFAKQHLGFKGCTVRKGQAPDCQKAAKNAGMCGRTLQVRCNSEKCKNKGWTKVKIVDVCPAHRGYHDKADPNSKGDNACANKNVLDLDVSLWQQKWGGGKRMDNVPIKIKLK